MLKFALLAAMLALPQDMPIPEHHVGRVTADGRFGWPGVYFEGRFKGGDVTVTVDPNGEPVRLLVDGQVRAVLTDRGEIRHTVSGLGGGEHLVRLEKVTESQSGGPRFTAFHTKGVSRPARPRAGQIEFIGDSYTVGYGNTSPVRECDAAKVRATTDTQLAFGPLAAKALGADYRVTAYSGYGVVRNYSGKMPGENLPAIYARAVPGDPAAKARDSAWAPRVIVINLGTNDFSTALKPGEAWADAAALHADYRAQYVSFIRRLKREQPRARFVLMASDTFAPDVEAVAVQAGALVVRMPALELTGCNWHPSLLDHRRMANLITPALQKLLPAN